MNALIIGGTGFLGKAIREELKDYTIFAPTRQELDLSNRESIEQFCKTLPKLDLYINTAATPLIFDRFQNIPLETFAYDIHVNVINQIYLVQKILPLLNQNAHVLFILTEMVVKPQAYFSSYITAKSALLGFAKGLAQELRSKEIWVNAVSPGMIDSPYIKKLPDMVKKIYLKKYKKFVDPKDVALTIRTIIKTNQTGQNTVVLPK